MTLIFSSGRYSGLTFAWRISSLSSSSLLPYATRGGILSDSLLVLLLLLLSQERFDLTFQGCSELRVYSTTSRLVTPTPIHSTNKYSTGHKTSRPRIQSIHPPIPHSILFPPHISQPWPQCSQVHQTDQAIHSPQRRYQTTPRVQHNMASTRTIMLSDN